jgi:hypothetical protein
MKKKKDNGLKSSSINRNVTALKAAISWAVKRSIIPDEYVEMDVTSYVMYSCSCRVLIHSSKKVIRSS